MQPSVVLREVLKTAVLTGAALALVAIGALTLESWAVSNAKSGGWQYNSHEQGRLIRSHVVDQPTVGVIA